MEELPDSNSHYREQEYWDQRYSGSSDSSFEWFGPYAAFSHLLEGPEGRVQKWERILVLGCGNSAMSYDMFHGGYRFITNIDYSSVCIENMRSKYSECTSMEWKMMDARSLEFMNESFDVVIEKGTLDALMVDEKDPWNVSPEGAKVLDQVLTEVS
ncbi:EEF1A lysine methyltransferase 4 [Protopterus annectens]|uniref:EEF1A lysine methyltransferase 4 n=1 Tax=Protopterus annectens TaxID=7888 RepID=UPI001CFC279B|nr:EEF1A lysine methyltransferase 4 [Protopterus annectens]